jgi:GNAT superfamily N-acetyltransferase
MIDAMIDPSPANPAGDPDGEPRAAAAAEPAGESVTPHAAAAAVAATAEPAEGPPIPRTAPAATVAAPAVPAAGPATPHTVAESIERATVTDLRRVLADHGRYWGERDLRALHLSALVQEFGDTCLVARSADGIRGYLFGFVTPGSLGYVHLIATRDDARGSGLGRRLYAAFISAARAAGADRLKAITSTTNAGSIAFHRSLGFDAEIVEDYDGPGQARVVFTRTLDWTA